MLYGGGIWLLLTQAFGVLCLATLGFVPVFLICRALHAYGLLRACVEEEARPHATAALPRSRPFH